MKKFIVIFTAIIIPAILYTSYLTLSPPPPPLSPLASPKPSSEGGLASPDPDNLSDPNSLIIRNTDTPVPPISYAFLPYWTIKDLPATDLEKLTHLAYFNLVVGQNGQFDTSALGYRRFIANYGLLKDLQQQYGFKLLATVTAPDDPSLFTLLNNSSAQANLINQLQLFTTHYELSGLNIDFEPQSATDSATMHHFTEFINQLQSTIQPSSHLAISIYPSAASSPKLWDLPALSPLVDHFIVMTYDYYRAGSATSGPISPLYPGSPSDRHAIIINLAQINRQVPSTQLLLGLPLYGYQWQTQDNAFNSPSLGTGQLATHNRIASLLNSDPSLIVNWNPTTLTPFLVFSQNDIINQIHFDTTASLNLKYQLVKDAGLAGIAYWALGYGPIPSF